MRPGRAAAITDTGRKRRRNEDAYVLRPPLFAVADGMGGAQAGEIASRLAVEALRQGDAAGAEAVETLIQAANRRVYERSSADTAVSGMGTTMTAAVVDGDSVTIGHVGDSRAYLLRDGRLEQLTEDHSLVAELLRTGRLSPEEAEVHPQRSVITRALGTDPDVDVDVLSVHAQPGDLFLLCSDGLTTMVDDETILQTIEEHRSDLDAAARALVRLANRGGGEDNITVLVFEIAGEDEQASDETGTLPRLTDEPGTVEEDTLTELDRVPAVDTMVVPVEEIRAAAAAYAEPEPRPGARAGRRVLAVAAVVLVVAVVLLLLAWGLLR